MNTVDVVMAVRRATVIVTDWGAETYGAVVQAMPPACYDRKVNHADWAVTVELLRRDYETPTAAADRLAQYMTLHAERWGETPTINGVRRTLLEGEHEVARATYPS